MKCPRCRTLNMQSDYFCTTCGRELIPREPTAIMPVWGGLLVLACVAIPVVTRGGAIPVGLGCGGAGFIFAVARLQNRSAVVRFVICLLTAVCCWALLCFMKMIPALNDPERPGGVHGAPTIINLDR